MPLDRYRQLALSLRAGHPLAAIEQSLDMLLIWLGNPDNPAVAALDAAIAESGLSRRVAAERAFDMLDRLLFGPNAEPARRLGLPAWIDREAAKRRYRRLVQAYHPDRHPSRARMLTARIEQINLSFAAFNRSRSALLGAEEANADATHAGDVGHATPFGAAPARPATRLERDPASQTDGGAADARKRRNRPTQGVPDPPHRARLPADARLGRGPGLGLSLVLVGGLAVLAMLALQTGRRDSDPSVALNARVEAIGGTAVPVLGAIETETSADLVSILGADTAVSIAPAPVPEPTATDPVSHPTRETAAPVEPTDTARPLRARSADLVLPKVEPVERIRPGSGSEAEVLLEIGPTAGMDVATRSRTGEVVGTLPTSATSRAAAVSAAQSGTVIATATPPRTALAAERLVKPLPVHSEDLAPATPSPRVSTPSGSGAESTAGRAAAPAAAPCKEVESATARFSRAYAAGDLDALMTLYAAQARENTAHGRNPIRRIYADWFRETSARRIAFRGLSKRTLDDRTCRAKARYSVSYRDLHGNRIDEAGTVTFTFEQQGSAFRIVVAEY